MLAAERRNQIMEALRRDERVLVGPLAVQFNVSEETIRRDLANLEQLGMAVKCYGGATLADNRNAPPFKVRKKLNVEEKKTVAALVAYMVEDGDFLMLDDSSTSYFVLRALHGKKGLTIVTNSVAAMRFFPKFPPHYVLISLGGSYDPQLNAFLGAATLRELERLSLTKAFVSCFGVNDKIATTNHEAQAGLITRVLDRTDRRYLLADRSKFGRTGLHKLAARGFFDAVVSER